MRVAARAVTEERTDEVIGAGLPRTGTLTQKLALEQLGLGPCYHWVNLIADLDQVELWHRALDGEAVWEEIFAGHESTVDWPGGYFYRELVDVYPEAKVLLSVRDPESWERSFRETIWTMSYGELADAACSRTPGARSTPAGGATSRSSSACSGARRARSPTATTSPAQLIEQMQRHNEQVSAAVPPERLLVWEVGEGWEPLCEFLGVPVPDEPLPHANDRETFLDRVIGGALENLERWHRESRASMGLA